MELTKYFEYNIFPQVIEYVKQHPAIDAKTALLIFSIDLKSNKNGIGADEFIRALR